VVKSMTPATSAKKVSSAEVKKMLGATPLTSTHTGPAVNDATYKSIVRQTFYDAWEQPSYEDVGGSTATVSIRLQKDGTIVGRALVVSSGSAILDASAMRGARAVKRIPGLTAEFVARHQEVRIAFKVEK
jgi:TonB family protein